MGFNRFLKGCALAIEGHVGFKGILVIPQHQVKKRFHSFTEIQFLSAPEGRGRGHCFMMP